MRQGRTAAARRRRAGNWHPWGRGGGDPGRRRRLDRLHACTGALPCFAAILRRRLAMVGLRRVVHGVLRHGMVAMAWRGMIVRRARDRGAHSVQDDRYGQQQAEHQGALGHGAILTQPPLA